MTGIANKLEDMPPFSSITFRRSASCRARAVFIASGYRSQSRVLPAMSTEKCQGSTGRGPAYD